METEEYIQLVKLQLNSAAIAGRKRSKIKVGSKAETVKQAEQSQNPSKDETRLKSVHVQYI